MFPLHQKKARKMDIINEETENSQLFSMIKSRVTQKAAINIKSRKALKMPLAKNKLNLTSLRKLPMKPMLPMTLATDRSMPMLKQNVRR